MFVPSWSRDSCEVLDILSVWRHKLIFFILILIKKHNCENYYHIVKSDSNCHSLKKICSFVLFLSWKRKAHGNPYLITLIWSLPYGDLQALLQRADNLHCLGISYPNDIKFIIKLPPVNVAGFSNVKCFSMFKASLTFI